MFEQILRLSACRIGITAAMLFTATHCFGQVADDMANPTPEQIQELIEQLVSPNPKPQVKGTRITLPKGFDREKQKRVRQARSLLKRMGPVAFPSLIEHWGDTRHCLTYRVGISGAVHNATVGKVCRDILYDQLQPYGFWPETDDGDPRGDPQRPSYPEALLDNSSDAKAWCEKHKGASLFEIQTLVIEWVIAQEDKAPETFSPAERERMRGLRDELKKRGEPMLRGSYWAEAIEQ